MANDAGSEHSNLYYSPGGRPLVIEEPVHIAQDEESLHDDDQASEQSTVPDQPLDLRQISPKSLGQSGMEEHTADERQYVVKAEAVTSPIEYERVSPVMIKYVEQPLNTVPIRQARSSASPVMHRYVEHQQNGVSSRQPGPSISPVMSRYVEHPHNGLPIQKPSPSISPVVNRYVEPTHNGMPAQLPGPSVSPVMDRYVEQPHNGGPSQPSCSSVSPSTASQPAAAASSSSQSQHEVPEAPRPFKAYLQSQQAGQLGYFSLSLPGAINSSNIINGLFNGLQNNDNFQKFRSRLMEQRCVTGRRINTILNSPRSIGTQRIRHPAPAQNPSPPQVQNPSPPQAQHPSPPPSADSNGHLQNGHPHPNQEHDAAENSAKASSSKSASSSRKRGRSNGDDVKDESYWERRRKNNEAAKRSRDARRAKEDEIAIRAAFLEQENTHLKFQLAVMSRGLNDRPINENNIRVENVPYPAM